jgi:hypothetical protein
MLNNPGKSVSIYKFGHLIGVVYPSAFNPCNVQSGFHVSGVCPVNVDIFRDYEHLSSYVTDKPGPTDQLTAPETHQTSSMNISGSLHPIETDQVVGPSISTPSTRKSNENPPKSLEENRPLPKAQSRGSIKKRCKPGMSSFLTDTPEKNEIEASQTNKMKSDITPQRKVVVNVFPGKPKQMKAKRRHVE